MDLILKLYIYVCVCARARARVYVLISHFLPTKCVTQCLVFRHAYPIIHLLRESYKIICYNKI